MISNPSIKKMADAAKINRVSADVYDEVRGIMTAEMKELARLASTYTGHANRKTLSVDDVTEATRMMGQKILESSIKKKYLIIPQAVFKRMIRTILDDVAIERPRLQSDALDLMHAWIEHRTITLLQKALVLQKHSGRETLKASDVRIAYRLCKK